MKVWVALLICAGAAEASEPVNSPQDFAYRMQVVTQTDAAAYRVSVPLAIYQKIAHPDLSDLRVFNGSGEQVPYAIARPTPATVSGAATSVPLFPLQDDSPAAINALRLTIESGKTAINLQSVPAAPSSGRVGAYLVDGRSVDAPVAGLRLEWPEDAPDFAGRLKIEISGDLAGWSVVNTGAPVANLHFQAQRLIEQRVEFPAVRAKYWRLSWAGQAAPFTLSAVLLEPARQSADVPHGSLTAAAVAAQHSPGEFEYDLGANVPVDRVNLDLPDVNTVAQIELESRTAPTGPWRLVRSAGFYRLRSDGEELRNGPVSVGFDSDRHWLLHADPRAGGLGKTPPSLVVEWIPHEIVFVARGSGPFYVAYGSATAESAAVSLTMLPKAVSIGSATLSDPEPAGGDARLRPPPTPYAWKNTLLWAVLVAGAGLLAWMALRLARDFARSDRT